MSHYKAYYFDFVLIYIGIISQRGVSQFRKGTRTRWSWEGMCNSLKVAQETEMFVLLIV